MLEKALNTGFNSQSNFTNERALQTFTPAKTSDLNYSQDSGDEETKGEPTSVNETEKKKLKEMAKIRQNELALAQLTKKRHKMTIDTTLN